MQRKRKVDAVRADPIEAGVQEMAPHSLPQHLHVVHEILRRLPHKSLCRCKLVCKEWLRLISDPYFIASHQTFHSGGQISPPFTGIFYQEMSSDWFDYPKPEFFPFEEEEEAAAGIIEDPSLKFLLRQELNHGVIVIRASGSGVLLCEKIVGSRQNIIPYESSYHLCNPLTEQHSELPPIPRKYMHPTRKSPRHWDIEFNQSSGLFFTVTFGSMLDTGILQILIFNSETQEWMEYIANIPNLCYYFPILSKMIILNDAAFWITDDECGMYVYHLKEKFYREFPLPNAFMVSRKNFWKHEGKLYYYNSTKLGRYTTDTTLIQLWVLLTEDYSTAEHEFQWELRHSVDTRELMANNLKVAEDCCYYINAPNEPPLDYCITAIECDFELQILFLRLFSSLVSYDLKTGKLKKLIEYNCRTFGCPALFPYKPNWALLHSLSCHGYYFTAAVLSSVVWKG